jgi:hypothetical protein
MGRFGEIFRDIKTRYEKQPRREPELICREGFHMNCDVLKLQKASWTNDDLSKIGNPKGGIFFSIWITEEGGRRGRADYNIHAIRLRELKGYRLTGNDFCDQFRKRFKRLSGSWPNVNTDGGCLTLFEGWIEIEDKSFVRDVLMLMNRFQEIAPVIDDLLNQRIKPPKRGGNAVF